MPQYTQPLSQFGINWITLSFPSSLERLYQKAHFEKSISQIRIGLLLGIVFYGAFGVLDEIIFPQTKQQLLGIRFFIVIPFIALNYLLTWSRLYKKLIYLSTASVVFCAGLGIIFMVVVAPSPINDQYYAGLLLVLFYGYTFFKMRYIWASLAGWLIVGAYEIASYFYFDAPANTLLMNNAFLLSANFIGMFASYSIEIIARRDFIHTHLLEYEKEKVEKLNSELETRVEQRTMQLINSNKSLKQEINERIEAEEKYRTLFEKSKDAVFITDLNGKFIGLNEAGVKLFGYDSLEEIFEVDIARDIYLHPQQRAEFERLMHKHGHVKDFEITCRRKDGKHITVLETATVVMNKDNNVSGYQGIIRDVTSQLELERQLIQSQKMESIGLLAGGIAHDLNNVLTPITMAIHILKENVTGEKQEALLRTLSENATRGADIVKQILTFARRTDTDYAPLLPGELIEEVARILRHTFPKNISIELKLPPKLEPILGNATQLHQILLNLCVNARDAMQDGGTLTIEAEYCEIDSAKIKHLTDVKPGKFMVIKVSDTGTGIPDAIIDRIFEPFFTTKQIGKGTGLGLSVIHSIIKGHGGFLEVESTINVGTQFSVFVPADQSVLNNNENLQPSKGTRGNNECILVVDDEESIRTLIKDVLEDNNYRVILAENGLKAIDQFKIYSADIDLILTDMLMPEMDGQAALKEIRAMRDDVPVVVISGLIDDKRIIMSELGATVQAILEKPFTAPELLNIVNAVFRDKSEK